MRRAMTWVYCEPKSRMTISSVIEKKTDFLPQPRRFDEKKIWLMSVMQHYGRVWTLTPEVATPADWSAVFALLQLQNGESCCQTRRPCRLRTLKRRERRAP